MSLYSTKLKSKAGVVACNSKQTPPFSTYIFLYEFKEHIKGATNEIAKHLILGYDRKITSESQLEKFCSVKCCQHR